MARPIRIEYEGACYHVVARGNECREIFRSDTDHQLFLKTLQTMLERFGIVLHCYCLMPNHYHLVVETPRANLSQAFAWLQTTYTVRYNRKHKRYGHLFQGRYKAHLIEADEYARHLINYIHLNPVRPRNKNDLIPVERRKTLDSYLWSSHREYLGKRQSGWVNTDWLSYWATKERQAKRLYAQEIQEWFGRSIPDPWEQLRGGIVLGSEKLWEKAQSLLDRPTAKHEIRWKEKQSQSQIDNLIRELLRLENDPKIQLWIRIRLGGQRQADIAQEQGYRDGSGVFRVVNRLEARASRNRDLGKKLEGLRRKVSIVKR